MNEYMLFGIWVGLFGLRFIQLLANIPDYFEFLLQSQWANKYLLLSEDMVILLTLGIAPYISAHFKLLFNIGESQACFASSFSKVVSIIDGRKVNGETC